MSSNRWRLDGRRALVTGGTKGIGRAIAQELMDFGAQVAIVARSAPDEPIPGATFFAADVAEPGAAPPLVAQVVEALGGLDILVNNVGTNIRKPSADYPDDDYARLFQTNVDSAFALCKAAYPHLCKAEGGGRIVQIGSTAGTVHVGSGGPYAMTKAALDQMTRYLSVEWAPDGIRVNSVNPWYTETPLASKILADPERLDLILNRTPLHRVAQPEDVAAVAAFLCLPASRHVTGVCVPVDGGFLAAGLVRPIL